MKYLPHRPIEDDFAVVRAGEKKNRQREKKKDKEGTQKKSTKETHKAYRGIEKLFSRQIVFKTTAETVVKNTVL